MQCIRRVSSTLASSSSASSSQLLKRRYKATIDVEAQDDGILGKIIVSYMFSQTGLSTQLVLQAIDGAKNVPVGKIIAIIAEEGDDVSNLEIPNEDTSQVAEESKSAQPVQAQQSSPKVAAPQLHVQHSRPLFPSVQRILLENGINNAGKIKGSGVRGMIPKSVFPEAKREKDAPKPMDGLAIRQLIVSSLSQSSLRARSLSSPAAPHDFDSIVADYLPAAVPTPKSASKQTISTGSYFDGLI
ncbi:hypothetical protein EW145_g2072 [Phellinidium pouzarii]|uniref:Peripheral subunit-binding (PSBD) domain-containing protein n=1 Tax=Phellinidium pouzarii TaxID=167371 RepID=A0A4S4LDY8_9AGAM|nr:hypothetical protein EW145_g2072 [Phellinidium pouzarii]